MTFGRDNYAEDRQIQHIKYVVMVITEVHSRQSVHNSKQLVSADWKSRLKKNHADEIKTFTFTLSFVLLWPKSSLIDLAYKNNERKKEVQYNFFFACTFSILVSFLKHAETSNANSSNSYLQCHKICLLCCDHSVTNSFISAAFVSRSFKNVFH